jgi:hypothetical protein
MKHKIDKIKLSNDTYNYIMFITNDTQDDYEDFSAYSVYYENNEWLVRIYGGWLTEYYKDRCQAHVDYLISNNIASFKFQAADTFLVLSSYAMLELI